MKNTQLQRCIVESIEKKWWKESVVYQVYPRSFKDTNGDGIGDLKGITEKLDYIKKLGVDVIWLSPVNKSPNHDNGYDVSDYRDIMDEFGTMEDFNRLMREAHARELRIIIDLVVNHTSDEHQWFISAGSAKDNPYRDYYFFRPGRSASIPPNNWKSWFGGSAWEYDKRTGEFYLHLYSKHQPDLNWDNKKVRKEMYDIMRFWLDKGVDGFRLDIINYISKTAGLPDSNSDDEHRGKEFYLNGPKVHEYLREMNEEVFSRYDIVVVGEVEDVSPEEARKYVDFDRHELDMLLSWEHMYVDYGKNGTWDIKRWKLKELKNVLSQWQIALDEKGWNAQYLSSHDQPRQVSRFGDDGRYRIESAKMLATLIHTLKGTPFIYQGEEIGMTNILFKEINECNDIHSIRMYNDEIKRGRDRNDLMKIINYRGRDNARTPMQWTGSKNAGFTEGDPWLQVNPNYRLINVDESLENRDSIFYYYMDLINLRKKNNTIVYGKYKQILEDDENIYSYVRSMENEVILVILNFGQDHCTFTLPEDIKCISCQLLLSNYEVTDTSIKRLTLRPYEARVYRLLSHRVKG